MTQKHSDLLDYAVSSFAFILPANGDFSFEEWADKITANYDAANVKISAVAGEIRKFNGKVIRNYGRTKIEID